jgi:tetratricopeptide (TPR) repeat protein
MARHETVDELLKQFKWNDRRYKLAYDRWIGFTTFVGEPSCASRYVKYKRRLRRRLLYVAKRSSGSDFLKAAEYLDQESEHSWHKNEIRETVVYYYELLELFTERLGKHHRLTIQAKLRLAENLSQQKHYEEAIAHLEQCHNFFREELGLRAYFTDTAFRRLQALYREVGRSMDADALRDERWRQLPVCPHLQPIEEYVIKWGSSIIDREANRDASVCVSVDACLDTASLQKKLKLASCVRAFSTFDPRSRSGQGFQCLEHLDVFDGRHPREFPDARIIS